MFSQYIYNLGLGLDQFVNVLLLGDPDESLSGRLGRAMLSNRPKFWVPWCASSLDWLVLILFGEKHHCRNAVEPEERPMDKELWSWIKAKK